MLNVNLCREALNVCSLVSLYVKLPIGLSYFLEVASCCILHDIGCRSAAGYVCSLTNF